MPDDVLVISPAFAPGSGGVGDYAQHVIQDWGTRARARLIGPKEVFTSLPEAGGKILLHYSAYGFHPYGYPRAFLRGLVAWKKRNARARLVLMLHEIWVFWPLLNKSRPIQWLHRRDLAKLLRVADVVFTSTPDQAWHLRRLVPTHAAQVMPVGSNIPVIASQTGDRDEHSAVVFGLQANRSKTLRRMQPQLVPLTSAGLLRRIVAFGGGNSAEGDRTERALLSAINPRDGFEQRGSVPVKEASRLLGTSAYALWGQEALSVTKSGTFMAYAAHGLNILSTAAEPLGAEPLCWLTSPAELLQGVSREELQQRADNLRAWQERTSSWKQIAQRFAEALQLPPA